MDECAFISDWHHNKYFTPVAKTHPQFLIIAHLSMRIKLWLERLLNSLYQHLTPPNKRLHLKLVPDKAPLQSRAISWSRPCNIHVAIFIQEIYRRLIHSNLHQSFSDLESRIASLELFLTPFEMAQSRGIRTAVTSHLLVDSRR